MKSRSVHILLLILLVFFGFIIGTSFTSSTEALVSDAQDYTKLATQLANSPNVIKDIVSPQDSSFIDSGYAIFLSLLIRLFGSESLIPFQLGNYILWAASAILIYISLIKVIGEKKAKGISVLMALSPVFMTFPAKLYSESLAALGVSIIIFSLIFFSRYKSAIYLFLGVIILLATKSIFLLLVVGLLLFMVVKRKWTHAFATSLALILIFPLLMSSMSGGRSRYTLAVQTAKLNMSYTENLACIPYHMSFPLGKAILPNHQNTCIIFSANPDLPRYEKNPVRIANQKYNSELSFTYQDAFKEIFQQPLKYVLVIFVDLVNLVFVEGFYANVLLDLPFSLQIILYTYGKILSLWLWYRLFKVLLGSWRQNWLTTAIYISPLLYFVFIVSHFHIEPRYFYPLLPWLYFAGSIKPSHLSKIIPKVIKS